jgi:hypothetical protein
MDCAAVPRGQVFSFSEAPMTTTIHSHWRHVPDATWRWPNFSPAEIACRGTGKLLINAPALDKLQALRNPLEAPRRCRLRHRHDQPRSGGVRGGTGPYGPAKPIDRSNIDSSSDGNDATRAARRLGSQGPCCTSNWLSKRSGRERNGSASRFVAILGDLDNRLSGRNDS